MPGYNNIVVLTGAGVSAESGVNTFRAADGLWENHRVEDVATPEAFARNPQLVQSFYNARRAQLLNGIAPNPAHLALAAFERDFSGSFTLITQNIDDLHERAGSENLLHMHGELLKIRCRQSQQLFECDRAVTVEESCSCCGRTGNLRPHVVWFGEIPLCMVEIEYALQQCDLFIAIGTSGNVYPAAGFYQLARSVGAHTVELNLEPSLNGSRFHQAEYGPASEVVPLFLASLNS